MGSSWRPSDGPLTPASLPDFGLNSRYGPHIFRRFDINPIQTSAQSRERSKDLSSLPSPICTTSRVADCYRPGDSLFRSTPPTSPGYPDHWSSKHDRYRKDASPAPFGSEDGQIGGNADDSDVGTIIEVQHTPPRSPVKFGIPTRIDISPVKNKNILTKSWMISETSLEKNSDPVSISNIKVTSEKGLEHALSLPPKPPRPIPTGPAAGRKSSSHTNMTTQDRNHMRERKKFPDYHGLQKTSTATIDASSCGTYPNNVIVVRPRFPHLGDRARAHGRDQLPLHENNDIDMKDAPPSDPLDISELLKDRPTVVKKVRDTSCQDGLSSHSLSYLITKEREGYGRPWVRNVKAQEVRDYGTSTCIVSITPPKPKPSRFSSETVSTPTTLGGLDIEILVSRIVGELKEKLVDVKIEKHEELVKEEKKEKSKGGHRKATTPPRLAGEQPKWDHTGCSLQLTAKKRLERRISKPRDESSGEDEDEGAFQRRRHHISSTSVISKHQQARKRASTPSYADHYGEEEEESNPKARTPANLHFRKKKRVETPVTDGQSKVRSPSIAFSTTASPCPFARKTSEGKWHAPSTVSSVPTLIKKPVETPKPQRPLAHKTAAGAAVPRLNKPAPLPDTFWFQRRYNRLASEINKPNILNKGRKCFNRRMLSYYLGGNARLTVSPISPSARISQIHRVSCVVAIKKEFVPNPANPGEIIVVCSPHDFEKQLPSGVSTFPVFLERGTAEWEYMGTYEFDISKRFSNKEADSLQDKNLIDFWLTRMFEMREPVTQGRGTSQKVNLGQINLGWQERGQSSASHRMVPTLCDSSVKSLAPQLVPTHLKSRKQVRNLTIRQVEKYLQDGTVKFNWNFLKPVNYDNALYRKLSEAAWPAKKGNVDAHAGLWSSLRNNR
ncbi:hypothetical protein AOL_s00043g714 [Orbilia oligospora ATCC 24927]|uniref:DUF6697 domain-containing protein n=1 Tax=Arthrobotrys oligospora (strain ATCC 24927 / CBS 115.81 / DSM 1491) TaxID=756982 RepID=G1X4U0_ARTOA|nr:hypothetical protein AOL_s00043g714 [Orbilia oligospora ATCC 24927]EGX51980.1 hypothetical protein AOL_s00043g714 [Orbilia oligospora ATCC 24927]